MTALIECVGFVLGLGLGLMLQFIVFFLVRQPISLRQTELAVLRIVLAFKCVSLFIF